MNTQQKIEAAQIELEAQKDKLKAIHDGTIEITNIRQLGEVQSAIAGLQNKIVWLKADLKAA